MEQGNVQKDDCLKKRGRLCVTLGLKMRTQAQMLGACSEQQYYGRTVGLVDDWTVQLTDQVSRRPGPLSNRQVNFLPSLLFDHGRLHNRGHRRPGSTGPSVIVLTTRPVPSGRLS
ncbi:hypothetical protein T01_10013 [Trichinella spiralis]|uniref:Uncharacterized protein n=2 Tax=Trichinella TaxID=6333 RepID=A0A0V1AYK7_TRISP|nr:hypothetical protein T05_14242 [Trichinella murrelli]KRY29874.1 hypothetical protein T01_10013 [Trichinella spiralis]